MLFVMILQSVYGNLHRTEVFRCLQATFLVYRTQFYTPGMWLEDIEIHNFKCIV